MSTISKTIIKSEDLLINFFPWLDFLNFPQWGWSACSVFLEQTLSGKTNKQKKTEMRLKEKQIHSEWTENQILGYNSKQTQRFFL